MEQLNNDKEFKLSSWAIENATTVYLVIFVILFGGAYAYTTLPKEDFPEIKENKVYISTVFPGNTSDDIEKLITRPIEDAVRDVSGIIKVQSTDYDDYAMTIIEFDDSMPMDEAKIEVKDKIDEIKADSDWPNLDSGAKVEPNVFDINTAEEMPILNINLSGDYDIQEIKDYAEIIQDKVEELQEIKAADIRGVDDKELEVSLDMFRMASSGVSFNDVVNAINADNKTISGGKVTEDNIKTNIRVVGEIEDPSELGDVAVKNQGGVVFLRDIATISFKEMEKTTYARDSGKSVVMIDVKKRSGQNMIDAVEKVRAIVTELQKKTIPSDINISLTNDQAPRTQNQVDDLVNNIIFGVILVVGVLMFFLGLKNATFVGIVIPLSMLMSLALVQLFGLTMNTMVLFALVMGLGMLVDNGIVLVENVYSLIAKGYSVKDAAKQGVGEIAWPIIASTATTLAAFFPLALWPGTMGKFMKYFPITLSIVLSSSLFIALVVNAMLTSKFMHSDEKNEEMTKKQAIRYSLILLAIGIPILILGFKAGLDKLKLLGNLSIFFSGMVWFYYYVIIRVNNKFQFVFLPKLEGWYKRLLSFALVRKHSVFFFLGTIALLILSFVLVGVSQPKVLFFPETYPNQVITYIEYPEGTAIEKTNEITKKIEENIFNVLKKYVVKEDNKEFNFMAENIISQVGLGATNPQIDAGSTNEIPHKAKITISLVEFKYRRGVNSKDLLAEIRKAIPEYPGVNISVESDPVGPPSGYPINIEIYGDDYNQMMDEAEKLIGFIDSKEIPGIEGLQTDVSRDAKELYVNVNEQKAGALGITNAMIGQTLRQALFGWEASRYKPKGDDDDYPINIRLNEDQKYNKDILFHQPVTFKNPANGQIMQVPISSLVTMENKTNFSQIKRENYKRTITVYSNVLTQEGYNSNEIIAKINQYIKDDGYTMPEGISFKFTGEQEEQGKQMAFLMKALLIGVIGIVLIIVLQFNSIANSLIIMLTVLLSFIGVFLGLVILGDDFVILMTMMGIISLAGIVVNNAIVLIDYTELLIKRKKEELQLDEKALLPIATIREILIEGGTSRLRPVLLTAITTVLGMFPLAVGFNVDFYGLFTNYNPGIYFGGDNLAFWGPLAKCVINGVTFATFLTLVVVPVMYIIKYKLKRMLAKV